MRTNRRWEDSIAPQGECIIFEGNSCVCLVVGAIERVNARTVAAQRHNDGAIGVEYNCSFTVALGSREDERPN